MPMDRRMRVVRANKSTAQDVREFAQTLSTVFPVDVPAEPVDAPETAVHESEETPEQTVTFEAVTEPETAPEVPQVPKPRRTRKRKTEPEPENDVVDMLLG